MVRKERPMSGDVNFEEIHETYRARVQRYLARLVGDAEAEDLTQEVFLKVSHAFEGFRGESQILTWIYRIATNTALDRLRSSSFKRSQDEQHVEHVEIIEITTPWTGQERLPVEQQAIREEMGSCIRHVVDQLPDNYRTAIVLSDLEGFKDNEIADILGVNLSAAKATLHRARVQLKEALSDYCVFYRNEENEFTCDRKARPKKAESGED